MFAHKSKTPVENQSRRSAQSIPQSQTAHTTVARQPAPAKTSGVAGRRMVLRSNSYIAATTRGLVIEDEGTDSPKSSPKSSPKPSPNSSPKGGRRRSQSGDSEDSEDSVDSGIGGPFKITITKETINNQLKTKGPCTDKTNCYISFFTKLNDKALNKLIQGLTINSLNKLIADLNKRDSRQHGCSPAEESLKSKLENSLEEKSLQPASHLGEK